jgi:hypothetical protein
MRLSTSLCQNWAVAMPAWELKFLFWSIFLFIYLHHSWSKLYVIKLQIRCIECTWKAWLCLTSLQCVYRTVPCLSQQGSFILWLSLFGLGQITDYKPLEWPVSEALPVFLVALDCRRRCQPGFWVPNKRTVLWTFISPQLSPTLKA